MQVYPDIDIRFPEDKEASLIDAMRSRASGLWRWQNHDAFDRPAEDGSFYFHRDGNGSAPPCTLCIGRKAVGHLLVQAIVHDADTVHEIPLEQYVSILRDFEEQVAAPAVNPLGGMTSIDTHIRTLEDYFSSEAIGLLNTFCSNSNAGDLGTHALDERKWIAFLLHVHRSCENVDGHTFGECLKAKKWWPEKGIQRLVHDYDFAMCLLKQADE